jgi:hypothetical protein
MIRFQHVHDQRFRCAKGLYRGWAEIERPSSPMINPFPISRLFLGARCQICTPSSYFLLDGLPRPQNRSQFQVWHGLPARENTGKMPVPQNSEIRF